MKDSKITATDIARALERQARIRNEVFFAQVKNGPTIWRHEDLLILDAISIKRSWTKPCITGYEIKVSRSDFTGDEKWPGYTKYCHRFYFAAPVSLISPDELPREVGLVTYNPEKRTLRTVRRAAYTPIELPSELLLYLIMNRVESDRYPFHSDARDFFKDWLANKKENMQLDYLIKGKIRDTLHEQRERIEELERQIKRASVAQQELEQVKAVLKDAGMRQSWTWGRSFAQQVKIFLEEGAATGVTKQELERIFRQAGEIKQIAEEMIRRAGEKEGCA